MTGDTMTAEIAPTPFDIEMLIVRLERGPDNRTAWRELTNEAAAMLRRLAALTVPPAGNAPSAAADDAELCKGLRRLHMPSTMEAADRIESLSAQLASAREDAERYRWLRLNELRNDWGSGEVTFHWLAPLDGGGSLEATLELNRRAFDAAIDAAIAGAKQEGAT